MLHLIFKGLSDGFSLCNWIVTTFGTEENVPLSMAIFLLSFLACIAAGYLLGSINSAIIVSRSVFGQDVRQLGSGNAGMTNMFRNFGKKGGFLTLAGDILKTVLSTLIGFLLIPGDIGAYVAGLFCVIGHSFPIYYRFRGGKGVLCAATMLLMLDLPTFALTVFTFAVVLIGLKMVSLASIMAAIFMPLWLDISYSIILGDGSAAGIRSLIAVLVTVLVVVLHIPNMKRILKNEEPKIRMPWEKKREKSAEENTAEVPHRKK